MRGLLVFCFLITLFVSTAFAAAQDEKDEEDEEIKAKEIVVTATKTEAEIKDIPSTVVIITKEEIKAKGAEKLKDILRFDAGFNILKSGSQRDVPSIRGFDSEHTLILIDGKRLAGEVTGENELDRITLENVERIEIVKGPVSSLYGTDALGGVINIITKTPQRFTFRLRPEYGFFNGGEGGQKNISAYVSGRTGNLGLSLSGTLLNAKPYFKGDQTTLQGDEEKKTVSLKADYDLSKFAKLTFDAAYMKEDMQSRSLSSSVLYRNIDDNERYDLSLGLSHRSPDIEYIIRAYISSYDKDYEYRVLSTNALGQFNIAERRTPVAEGKVTKEIFHDHLFTLGGEYRQEFFKGNRINTGEGAFTTTRESITEQGSEAEINYWAGYLQDEWQVSDSILVIPSIRYDDSSEFESNVSPKIGVTYKIFPELRLKASYGQGFKSPTPKDLYYEFRHIRARYMVMGNPELNSEKADSYEISLEGERSVLSGKIVYFYNDIKELIEAVQVVPPPAGTPDGWRYFTYQNINKARIQGIEAEIGLSFTKEFSLKGSYAYMDARDETEDTRLTRRPRHKAVPKLVYDNKAIGLRGNIWGEYIGDNLWQAASGTTPEKIKDYALWYLNLSKDLGERLEVYAGIDNIFDREDDDIPLIGALYYGGVSVKF